MLPLPPAIHRLRDNGQLRFGGRDWQVLVCGGHAAEHASFWCAADKILIAGDQILSKISPMIGVFPGEPTADPLSDYLGSLDRFRALPADSLVLPSHGVPFYGLIDRANELGHHHELRLLDLERLMDQPKNAMILAHGLFAKAVADGQARHAFAETLAHLHYLVTTGRAHQVSGPNGGILFSRT
jgi:glyoxylase-like metal-dependent hydrolase (beta-lactamase superfamily II)